MNYWKNIKHYQQKIIVFYQAEFVYHLTLQNIKTGEVKILLVGNQK